jgi:hypothetical protein
MNRTMSHVKRTTPRSNAVSPRPPAMISAKAPKQVAAPVRRMRPVAVPLSTLLLMKQRFGTSNASCPAAEAARSRFSAGMASPVSVAWLTWRSLAVSRRRSAGTRSPAASWTMSPGTNASTGTSRSADAPAPVTRQAVVRTKARSFAAAWLDRCSCAKPNSTLSRIMVAMTAAARGSPVSHDTPASDSSKAFGGFFFFERKLGMADRA